jgi:phenylpyruvate tautomerase PptA (4-oxalocrotonate tautomerase family)
VVYLSSSAETLSRYTSELNERSASVGSARKRIRYDRHPTALKCQFLLSSLSRLALRLAENFMSLSFQKTIDNHDNDKVVSARNILHGIPKLDGQISLFMTTNNLPPPSVVSVAIDAMAMNRDRSYLPSKDADYRCAIYRQPVDRRYQGMPLHTISSTKGQSNAAVKAVIDQVCQAFTDRDLVVEYFCSDGDPGYHDSHEQFFASWIDIFWDDGLEAGLNHARVLQ